MGLPVSKGSRLFLFRQRFNVRKEDKADQADQYDEESIDMEKKNPRLTEADNPKNDDPHGDRFKVFHTQFSKHFR